MNDLKHSITILPATPQDIPAMLRLLDSYARKQLVLPRTAADLEHNYVNFILAKDGEHLVGLVALRPYGDGFYEIRSLAVAHGYKNAGVGTRLVLELLDRARAMQPPAANVFALTKRPHLFQRLGFRLAYRERFPGKIWTDCLLCPKYNNCDETAVEYRLNQ
ncbi:MAG: GNAT family N-acetyltransferase [Victivallales bacterium]|nr:GNAT family N-acetyltransferase [Victivallales bacterium]